MSIISHVHASGRFNQDPNLFADELRSYREIASVVTVTEVDNNQRARLLQEQGWKGVFGDKGPRDDCGITWDPAVWEKIYAGTVEVSDARYKNDRGWTAAKTVPAFAVLRHKTTQKIVVWGSLHTPHGMGPELRADKVHSDVARAFVSISRGYKSTARKLAKQYNADAIALSGDWNLNIRLLWVREYLKRYSAAQGYKLNWTGNFPSRGTHGKEIIDATLYKGMTLQVKPRILANRKGNDHTGYVEKYNLGLL